MAQSQRIDLQYIVHNYLGEYLKNSGVENRDLTALISNQGLSLEDLKRMEANNSFHSLPNNLQGSAWGILWARIAIASLHQEPFSPENASTFVSYTQELQKIIASYSYLNDSSDFAASLSLGVLETEKIPDLNYFYDKLIELKNNGCDVSVQLINAEQRYSVLLSNAHNDISVRAVRDNLRDLLSISKRQVNVDLKIYIEIAAALGFTYIEADDTKSRYKKEILGLIKELNLQDPVLKDKLRELEQVIQPKKPSENPAIQEVKVKVPDANPRGALISDRQQVQLESRPMYSNTESSLEIYIFKGTININGPIRVAVKEYLHKKQNRLDKFISKEIPILEQLSGKHPCYLNYYGNYQYRMEDGKYCLGIVMELCEQNLMDVLTYRKKKKNPFTEEELKVYVSALINGFTLLNSQKIYHLDVRPHNILVTSDGSLKIADFNISMKIDDATLSTVRTQKMPIQGADGYMAPEIQVQLDKQKRGEKADGSDVKPDRVDVFSLGLTFLQMYTLDSVQSLNKEINKNNLENAINNVRIPWLKEVLSYMLVFDFRQRLTMKRLTRFLPKDITTIEASYYPPQ